MSHIGSVCWGVSKKKNPTFIESKSYKNYVNTYQIRQFVVYIIRVVRPCTSLFHMLKLL